MKGNGNKAAFNVDEAADFMGISGRTLTNRLIHQPDFPAFRVGRRWIIPCKALENYMQKMATKEQAQG